MRRGSFCQGGGGGLPSRATAGAAPLWKRSPAMGESACQNKAVAASRQAPGVTVWCWVMGSGNLGPSGQVWPARSPIT